MSTWFTLNTEQIEEQVEFIIGFLDRIPEDLKRPGSTVASH